MPDGRIQRIDDKRNLAYVVWRGRTYRAPLDQVETRARVPSARVHFKLVRRDGSEHAEEVRLRTGTRTSRRQRRFGDLTGAARPGAKVETIASSTYGVDVTTQPFRVAQAWIDAMSAEDFDGATSLYLPGASIRTATGQNTGRRRIRVELEQLPAFTGPGGRSELHGVDRYVRVDCSFEGDQHSMYLVIERGQIAEQWIDLIPTVPDPDADVESVDIPTIGDITDPEKDYAAEKLGHLVEGLGLPVQHAELKLVRSTDASTGSGGGQPPSAEASVEFERVLIRAHSTGATPAEATDLVIDRLARRIEDHRGRRLDREHGREAVPDSWRHGDRGRPRMPYFDRPQDQREIVRHKSFTSEEMTVDEAAWDMSALDYDFYLFVELTTGQDSVLETTEDGTWLLRQLEPGPDDLGPMANPVVRSDVIPPELGVSGALDLLNATGDRLLFFHNPATGRGNVIYRRYDGHYGLVTPRLDELEVDVVDDIDVGSHDEERR